MLIHAPCFRGRIELDPTIRLETWQPAHHIVRQVRCGRLAPLGLFLQALQTDHFVVAIEPIRSRARIAAERLPWVLIIEHFYPAGVESAAKSVSAVWTT